MNEKPVKVPMDFNEALRRIADTPKSITEREYDDKKKINKDDKKLT